MKTIIRSSLLLLALSASSVWAQDQVEYQAKLDKLQSLISQLQTELEQAKSSRDILQVDLKKSETDINALLLKIEKINTELAAQKKS